MDWTLILVLQVLFQPSLSDVLTVVAERNAYDAEFGGDVVMGCRFQPVPKPESNPNPGLTVAWHWVSGGLTRVVYRMDSGVENLASQDPEYQGRARLLTEELSGGWSKLQVSKLRISDSGNYQCLVQRGEADYKSITLSVKAPYRTVTTHVQDSAEGDGKLLTCQSEGYPLSSVEWHDGNLQRLSSNTTSVSTADQLFRVTSQIQVSASDEKNYTCSFTNDGYSETFQIPEEIPTSPVRKDALIIALGTSVVLVVIIVAVLTYRRRKGARCNTTPSTKNPLVDIRASPAAAASGLQRGEESEEEEVVIINEGIVPWKKEYQEVLPHDLFPLRVRGVETLGEFLRAHYCGFSFFIEARHQCDRFCVEEQPQTLQSGEGQPVSLQALIPEPGQMLLLEGPPESGKTTVAQILVSAWVEGTTHTFSNLFDLSELQVLLYVDCTKVKGDLYREVTTQLHLGERLSTEDELRTVLSGCGETLLLLDGYREGTQVFDESLRRFLKERGDCRVLVTACSGHCPELRETVGTAGLLKLQI